MINTHESNPNNQVLELIEKNELASAAIARNPEQFNVGGADMIMRNMAVLSDRLNVQEFEALSKEARDQVAVVVHIANDVAPIDELDIIKHARESDQEYEYRKNVRGPMFALHRKISLYGEDESDQLLMSKIRFGVEAAGKAFGSVLHETQHLSEVNETISYFQGNTNAAVRSVNS